jgi:hypothetical protein
MPRLATRVQAGKAKDKTGQLAIPEGTKQQPPIPVHCHQQVEGHYLEVVGHVPDPALQGFTGVVFGKAFEGPNVKIHAHHSYVNTKDV